MKRKIAFLLTAALCFALCAVPALAADTPAEVVLSEIRIDLEDGSYYIETITETRTLSRASEKTGSKTGTYYSSSGDEIFSVTVSGTFTYTGSSATATSAEATVLVYDSSASFVRKSASTSGATASATGVVSYLSANRTKTVSLTCSASGVLS